LPYLAEIPTLPDKEAASESVTSEAAATDFHPGERVVATSTAAAIDALVLPEKRAVNESQPPFLPIPDLAPSGGEPGPKATGLKRNPESILEASGAQNQDSPVASAAPTATAPNKRDDIWGTPTKAARKRKLVAHSSTHKPPVSVPSCCAETSDAADSTCESTGTHRAASESDFKSAAEAAVSSLILSTMNSEIVTEMTSEAVDTSTEYVKALAGSNWVTACAGVVAAGNVNAKGTNSDSKSRKRQNLSADERARQNRDRNREHARNTRLRKKAYVEELKRTLTELVAQRDRADLIKQQSAQRELEQREVRFRVIEEFLKLRARNDTNYASWEAILHKTFSLTMPCDAVNRSTVASGMGTKLEYTFSGVPDVMKESSNFASFLQSINANPNGDQFNAEVVKIEYTCDRKNFFMDDNRAVLDWTAKTDGLVARVSLIYFPGWTTRPFDERALSHCTKLLQGLQAELSLRGSVRACFCTASNKLLSASVMFDTGAIHTLINAASYISGTPTVYSADQEANHRANAIFDSIQMPHFDTSLSATLVPGDSSDDGSRT
jgi:hypothetical protein